MAVRRPSNLKKKSIFFVNIYSLKKVVNWSILWKTIADLYAAFISLLNNIMTKNITFNTMLIFFGNYCKKKKNAHSNAYLWVDFALTAEPETILYIELFIGLNLTGGFMVRNLQIYIRLWNRYDVLEGKMWVHSLSNQYEKFIGSCTGSLVVPFPFTMMLHHIKERLQRHINTLTA